MEKDENEQAPSVVVGSDEAPASPPEQVTGLKEEQTDVTNNDDGSITWTASEFVAHEKSAGWYLLLAVAAIIIAVLIHLLTKDLISVAVVIVAAMLLGVYGSHKPRQLEYRLGSQGIDIGPKHYSYDQFRTFSVVPEGAFASIVFMPLKRFAPPISIYYSPDDEERITTLLTDKLPFEEGSIDALDKLVRKIRF